jgi:hypothetical protein
MSQLLKVQTVAFFLVKVILSLTKSMQNLLKFQIAEVLKYNFCQNDIEFNEIKVTLVEVTKCNFCQNRHMARCDYAKFATNQNMH